MLMGVPSVCPSKTPERMRTVSDSLRWVDERALARGAAVEVGLDVGLGERQARRAAVDDGADRRAVRLAPGGDAEEVAEGVAHATRILRSARLIDTITSFDWPRGGGAETMVRGGHDS